MTPICKVAETLALGGYLAAAVLYPQRLLRPESRSTQYAKWGLLVGAGLQGVGLAAHAVAAGVNPPVHKYATVAFVMVLLIVAGLVWLEARTERPAAGAFLAPVVFLLVIFTSFESSVDIPMLADPWFEFHIALALLSYACFGVAFCMAMAYLANDWCLKNKRIAQLPLLPALPVADHIAHVAVAIGLPMFTLGLGVGLAFLLKHHLAYDLKVAIAVVQWIIYAVYLLAHDVPGWRWQSRWLHRLLVLGFALTLLNFVGARHHFPVTSPPAARAR